MQPLLLGGVCVEGGTGIERLIEELRTVIDHRHINANKRLPRALSPVLPAHLPTQTPSSL